MSEKQNKQAPRPERGKRPGGLEGVRLGVDRARSAALGAFAGAGRWIARQAKKLPGGLRRLRRRLAGRLSTWRKVKTAAIALLVAANLALLGVLVGTQIYSRHLAAQNHAEMDALLAERGVTCGSSVYDSLEDYPQPYSIRMDASTQDAFARALLTGTVQSEADKGNATLWTGENGELRWAASGDVSGQMTLSDQAQPTTLEEARELALALLEAGGLEADADRITVSQDEDNTFEVEIPQYIGTTELLGCSLTFTIAEGNETTIDGKWCAGEAQAMTVRALRSYSPEQALFQLLNSQEDITQIISVQPVYVLSDRSGGRFTVIPCWRFSADSGDYVLNILTGDVVASSDVETTVAAEDETETDEENADDTDAGESEDTTSASGAVSEDTDSETDTQDTTDADSAQADTDSQDETDSAQRDEESTDDTEDTGDTDNDSEDDESSGWYDDGEVAYETN